MKTEENNKLIAEFLGWEILSNWGYLNINNGESHEIENLKFHNDWNWLMEVVEKIESDGRTTVIFEQDNLIIITTLLHNIGEKYKTKQISKQSKVKKEAVYNACVEFIKWYNKQTAEEK